MVRIIFVRVREAAVDRFEDNNILRIKYMIIIWLITILFVTMVTVYALIKLNPEKIVQPMINPLLVNMKINKTSYIYTRGNDISLQNTLGCIGGMEMVANDDGTYNIKCTYLYLTYNPSDGLTTLSETRDLNSYFKILKAGDDEFIITTPDEKKILMFSGESKKFYMLNPYENDINMTKNIYMTFELNKRENDIDFFKGMSPTK